MAVVALAASTRSHREATTEVPTITEDVLSLPSRTLLLLQAMVTAVPPSVPPACAVPPHQCLSSLPSSNGSTRATFHVNRPTAQPAGVRLPTAAIFLACVSPIPSNHDTKLTLHLRANASGTCLTLPGHASLDTKWLRSNVKQNII